MGIRRLRGLVSGGSGLMFNGNSYYGDSIGNSFKLMRNWDLLSPPTWRFGLRLNDDRGGL